MTKSFSYAYRVKALFCAAILAIIVVFCQDTLAALKPKTPSPYDAQVKQLLSRMTPEEKIGQVIPDDQEYLRDPADIEKYYLGSLLSGGNSDPKEGNSLLAWTDLYDSDQQHALKTRLDSPILYGIDAVHGHSNVLAAAIFPHDIGIGYTGNTALVQEQELEETRTPDVIFVPTPQDVVERMLKMANVKKDDLLYDLGCGDGRIVVMAAKKYGCKCVGFDIDPERVKESRENVRKNNVEHLVRIEQKDIFTLDLSEADVITLYLLRSLNVKLIPQLEKLKPGSRIVSHDFDMRGIKPETAFTVISNEDQDEHDIFLWTTPLNKEEESDE